MSKQIESAHHTHTHTYTPIILHIRLSDKMDFSVNAYVIIKMLKVTVLIVGQRIIV